VKYKAGKELIQFVLGSKYLLKYEYTSQDLMNHGEITPKYITWITIPSM